MEIGVDIVAIDRFCKMERYEYSAIMKLLTENEVEYGKEADDLARYYAECMACKEAVFKCMDEKMKISYLKEIEFSHLESGKPCVNLYGTVKDIFVSKGMENIKISISYEEEYVIAFVMAY